MQFRHLAKMRATVVLPVPARPAKQISMGDAFLGDGIGQRLCDVFLADDIGETLRAVFAGDDLITHGLIVNQKSKIQN